MESVRVFFAGGVIIVCVVESTVLDLCFSEVFYWNVFFAVDTPSQVVYGGCCNICDTRSGHGSVFYCSLFVFFASEFFCSGLSCCFDTFFTCGLTTLIKLVGIF